MKFFSISQFEDFLEINLSVMFHSLKIAGALTPVPGGVGPMTLACLLVNTLVACCRKHRLSEPDIIPN